ncbi:hypothetical protein OUHCRE20_12920 [Enterobacter hormaechei subsp. steigerwaltii]|nr:hypothetical protein NIHE100087_17460 [Enterobacter hormaechei]
MDVTANRIVITNSNLLYLPDRLIASIANTHGITFTKKRGGPGKDELLLIMYEDTIPSKERNNVIVTYLLIPPLSHPIQTEISTKNNITKNEAI